MNYRPIPWSIAGLLAHELAHTISVVHPFQLTDLCTTYSKLPFCSSTSGIPNECNCATAEQPPERCLMTYSFGRAKGNAATYTSCDIQTMNYFATGFSCLIRVKTIFIN